MQLLQKRHLQQAEEQGRFAAQNSTFYIVKIREVCMNHGHIHSCRGSR